MGFIGCQWCQWLSMGVKGVSGCHWVSIVSLGLMCVIGRLYVPMVSMGAIGCQAAFIDRFASLLGNLGKWGNLGQLW